MTVKSELVEILIEEVRQISLQEECNDEDIARIGGRILALETTPLDYMKSELTPTAAEVFAKNRLTISRSYEIQRTASGVVLVTDPALKVTWDTGCLIRKYVTHELRRFGTKYIAQGQWQYFVGEINRQYRSRIVR